MPAQLDNGRQLAVFGHGAAGGFEGCFIGGTCREHGSAHHLSWVLDGSGLQLALELIEEAPVSVPGDQFLWAGLDQTGFVHA